MRRGLEALGYLLIRVAIAVGATSVAAPELAFAVNFKSSDWEATNLDVGSLQGYVNSQNCYNNQKNFLGCIEAINTLLAKADTPKVLSNPQIANLGEMKETVQQFDLVEIKVSVPINSSKSGVDMWKQHKATRDRKINSWKSLYTKTKQNQLPIEAVLSAAIASTGNELPKEHIANALNSYFSRAFDPHTQIVPASAQSAAAAKAEINIIGIGVIIQKYFDYLFLQPLENSPAARAGIQNLDRIIKVDGKSVENLSTQSVANMILGTEGTTVSLSILRNDKLLNIQVLRAPYLLKHVQTTLLFDPLRMGRKIGYIKVATFNSTQICKNFVEAAKYLKAEGAETLVVDLRNNRGGRLTQAKCILNEFLDKGQIAWTEVQPSTNKTKATIYANGTAELFNLYGRKPVIILQNSLSASASEIVAGSLVTYGRGIVVGERSYGKGTIQDSKAEGQMTGITMMKTVSRFHFASGGSNQLFGINPDIVAYKNPNPSKEAMFALREADLYTNPIASAKPPLNYPKSATAIIKSCIDKRNVVLTEHQNPHSAISLDYQLLMARDAASCLIGR